MSVYCGRRISVVSTCRAMAYQTPGFVAVNVKVQLEIFPRLVTVPEGQTSPHSSTPYGLLRKKRNSGKIISFQCVEFCSRYLVFDDHRQRRSSLVLASETGILMDAVLLTMTYCGEVTCATGGVLIRPSGRLRRSIKETMDQSGVLLAVFSIGLQAESR